jgi:hypothetical protein
LEQIISSRITTTTEEEWKKKAEEFYSVWRVEEKSRRILFTVAVP